MKKLIIRILFWANLIIVGIVVGISFRTQINIGFIFTAIGALLAAIICGREILKMNKKESKG